MNIETIKWENDITHILNIRYPIVQAPMFAVSTPQMVAAATDANVLGSLPLGDLPADKCVELIRATKQIVKKPFAANIFLNKLPELSDGLQVKFNNAKKFIEELAKQHGIQVVLPNFDQIKVTDYHEQVDALIAEKCRIVSFTFGIPDEESVKRFKGNGTILIGTSTSVEEASILEQLGIDIICVQGIEAGGHRGTFTDVDLPKIGGFSLLSQVYDNVKTPLIYAGGIYDAKTLLAARTLGAQGFQVGSLLVASAESALMAFEKERLRNAKESDISLTKSFSGRYARGIQNVFTKTLDNTEHILPYPYQNKLTAELRKTAKLKKNAEFVSIWAGQSLNSFSGKSTKDILINLIEEVENYI